VYAQPLWLECYLFELPFDSGIPDGYVVHQKDDPAAPIEQGWEGFDLAEFLGIFPPVEPGQMCSTTLTFRRAMVNGYNPLAGINSAFPEVLRNSQLGHPWWRGALVRSPLRRRTDPPPTAHTVVKAERIAIPPPTGDVEDGYWRGAQITTALRHLNECLEAVAGVRTNSAVGSVRAPELPPLLFGYRIRLPERFFGPQREYEHFALTLHEYIPWGTEPLTKEQVDGAIRWSTAHDAPMWAAMRWMRDAERSLLQENMEHAVVEASTAIELAISDAVRLCAPLAGYSAEKVENVLSGAFAARVKDHFAKLLGFADDPDAAADPLGDWWRNGYVLRNQVVHRGRPPRGSEPHRAVATANALLDEIIERMRSDDRYRTLFHSPDTPMQPS